MSTRSNKVVYLTPKLCRKFCLSFFFKYPIFLLFRPSTRVEMRENIEKEKQIRFRSEIERIEKDENRRRLAFSQQKQRKLLPLLLNSAGQNNLLNITRSISLCRLKNSWEMGKLSMLKCPTCEFQWEKRKLGESRERLNET